MRSLKVIAHDLKPFRLSLRGDRSSFQHVEDHTEVQQHKATKRARAEVGKDGGILRAAEDLVRSDDVSLSGEHDESTLQSESSADVFYKARAVS